MSRHIRPAVIFLVLTAVVALGASHLLRQQPIENKAISPKEETSGALQALEDWTAQRAYPHDVVPDAGFYLAYEHTERMRGRSRGIDDFVAPWETLGPVNMAGRSLTLAFDPVDPDIIYVGAASGGLWRSTTAGVGADAWDYVETGYPVLGVSTIAIQPDDRDVIYIGTGEVYRYQESIGGPVIRTTRGSYGIGILKTTDGGATWTKSLDWSYSQTRGVWSVRIDPDDHDIVHAATTEGIYRSDDAGATWTLKLSALMGTDLRIHPTNSDILYAACGNFGTPDRGIYRSTDRGDSWVLLGGGLPTGWTGKTLLDVTPAAPDMLFASMANEGNGLGIYRSTDRGDTWTRVTSANYAQYQGWFSHWVLVSPWDANEVFAGGIDIWRSLSGGSGLSQRSYWYLWYFGTPPAGGPEGPAAYAHADHHYALYHPTDPDVIYFATDGGVFRTTDGGGTFEGCNGGYQSVQFYNGFSTSMSTAEKAMGGLQDNATVIYEGSIEWRREIGGDGFWSAIHPTDPDLLYGEYYYLNMLRSRNGGNSWSNVSPPEQGGDVSAFSAPYVLSPSHPTVLFAGRSRVYRSDNEGNSWTATNGGDPLDGSNPALSMAISYHSPDTAYVGMAPIYTDASIHRTRDGGATWDDVTGPLPDRYPSDLAVWAGDANRVFATFSGFGTPHLFRSTDGGDNWEDIGADLPDLPTSAVEIDPVYPEIVYVGNDLGVYLSIDGGDSWEPFFSGMPTAMVSDLKVSLPNGKLRVSTHGNGIYERDLYDPTGQDVASDEAPERTGSLALRVSPNPLRAGSQVHFSLPRKTSVRLSLCDVTGREIQEITRGSLPAGDHSFALNPGTFPRGVYFVRLAAGGETAASRVVYTE